MEEKRTPFNIKLSGPERERLEAHRVRLGLRSHADVIRLWIGSPPKLNAAVEAPARINWTEQQDPQSFEPQLYGISVGPIKPKPGSLAKKAKK